MDPADVRRFSAPWFDPVRPWIERIGTPDAGPGWLARLNDEAAVRGLYNEAGRPIRFVDSTAISAAPGVVDPKRAAAAAGIGDRNATIATGYESRIATAGEVPTRLDPAGAWHDYFNALAWLEFPRIKARLNRLQAEAIGRPARPAPVRGRLRDAATLFDENAALFVTRDTELAGRLQSFEWQRLFVDARERFIADVRVLVVGHGLMHRLMAPYKSICAHAWVVPADADCFEALAAGDSSAIDAAVAGELQPASLQPRLLTPLPVLGIPGWWTPNSDPAFYNDHSVFRRRRHSP